MSTINNNPVCIYSGDSNRKVTHQNHLNLLQIKFLNHRYLKDKSSLIMDISIFNFPYDLRLYICIIKRTFRTFNYYDSCITRIYDLLLHKLLNTDENLVLAKKLFDEYEET